MRYAHCRDLRGASLMPRKRLKPSQERLPRAVPRLTNISKALSQSF
jgi:hypothetical protein